MQVAGFRSQVSGCRSQVAGLRFQVAAKNYNDEPGTSFLSSYHLPLFTFHYLRDVVPCTLQPVTSPHPSPAVLIPKQEMLFRTN